MITINYSPYNRCLRFKGHANYDKTGKDIICSAVSTLFYTLAETLDNEKEYLLKFDCTDNKNWSEIKCIPKEGHETKIDIIYFTVLSGLNMLSHNYPEYVNLKIHKKN